MPRWHVCLVKYEIGSDMEPTGISGIWRLSSDNYPYLSNAIGKLTIGAHSASQIAILKYMTIMNTSSLTLKKTHGWHNTTLMNNGKDIGSNHIEKQPDGPK